jgi:non-ribosomal peptide synthetase component F
LVTLFEEQAKLTPANIALVSGTQELNYQQLNERANQLARHLISQGVELDTLVPICVDRSFEMMIGILAILKAGGAYVPVDPEYPIYRIQYMLQDTKASIILTSQKHIAKLADLSIVDSVIAVDGSWNNDGRYASDNLGLHIKETNLAYVLYTSGSTGKPKGVKIEHNSISHHLHWFTNQYNINSKDSSFLISSFSFD